MDAQRPSQPLDAVIAALRYTLAQLDGQDAGAMFALPLEAVPALATLVIGGRRAFAEQLGISGAEAQDAYVRRILESELETHTLAVLAQELPGA